MLVMSLGLLIKIFLPLIVLDYPAVFALFRVVVVLNGGDRD
jgi:hypothetical protein